MLLLSALLGACGDEEPERMEVTATVTGLEAAPQALAFEESWEPRQIAVQADFDDGSAEEVTAAAAWSSDDESVATVSAGRVTPRAAGTTVVRARLQGRAVAVPVTVDVVFTDLGALPDSLTFGAATAPVAVQLFARYSDGSEQDVSAEATWASGDDAVATVNGNGTVTAVGLGDTVITAGHGGEEKEIPVSVAVSFSGGEGSDAAPYAITTAEQLHGLRFYTGDGGENLHFELMGDLDLSDPVFVDDTTGWVPIGTSDDPFAATLDGNGFTISGLSINRPQQGEQGLFGHLGGVVTDLHLASVTVVGETRVGALAGRTFNATVSGVTASGSVTTLETATAGSVAGGLVGYAANSEITDSGTDVTVTGVDHNLGGLVGSAANTRIRSCRAHGDVFGNGSEAINIGGLAGVLDSGSRVENSYATGAVHGTAIRNGGLVGIMGSGAPTIENSYSAGMLNAADNGSSGGLVGDSGEGTVADSFYTDDQFGESPDKGSAITPVQLADQSTFTDAGWDFASVWAMSAGGDRPVLRWEP